MSMVERLRPDEALAALHCCLEAGAVIPTRHFRDELANEGLTFEDAWVVLRSGAIYDPPDQDIKTGEWKYRVEGHEPGGSRLVVVVCFRTLEMTILVTVYSVQTGGKRR